MAYSPIPVRFHTDINGHGVVLERDGAVFGTVDTFLISYWQYGFANTGFFYLTDNPGGSVGHNIQFRPNHQSGGGQLVVGAGSPTVNMLQANYTGLPDAACPCHFLISVRLSTSTIQFYLNDALVSGSVTWSGAAPITFNGATTRTSWGNPDAPFLNWNAGYGSDFWLGTTSGFVDLSVVANRRKFINADLTPVDLGTSGQDPFGTPPQLFQNILSGGVANDWLINRGSAGGAFALNQSTMTLDGNPCGTPVVVSPTLAMDDVLVTATMPPDNQIYLEWSDTRGHSYGIPVGQSIGEAGAYLTSLQWQRLGLSRDRCFRLTWSAPVATALQGAWIEVTPALT